MERGEVWWADLPEPWGHRPAVLIARDEAYTVLSWVTVAPLTTRTRSVPTVVALDPGLDGVPQPSVVTLDHIQAIPRARLDSRIGRLRPEKLREVDRAIHFALGLRNCS